MKQEIWVYSAKQSPRLDYVLNFISKIWDISFKITSDIDEFTQIETAKINYSHQDLGGIQIQPQKLLFEKGYKLFDFSNLELDSFAMIFFLLSRYEEYVIQERDTHNRFLGSSSYLFKTNRLKLPWVDVLIQNLKNSIHERYPDLKFKEKEFKKQLTIDIDQAYLYQNKSFKRFVGANLRDALKLNLISIARRKLSYFFLMKDPWDVYQELKINFEHELNKPIFFFQVGDYAEFDKNLNFKNKAFQKLIKNTNKWASVGLHPSYQSNQDASILKTEVERLEQVLGKPVAKSRQHYIKLDLPSTYQNLLANGIQEDYSMGFADQLGFRAGTAHSFNWYDLSQEKETNLKIHPFCAMDVTLKNYLRNTPNQAHGKIRELENTIELTGGSFCMICHNESLSDFGEWKGWRESLLSSFIS
ncbi:polysaccharide deacetylase family protein [Weeksellaceae bacterium KMM 9724]|uniref:polysaccharide deacetylase family protein n=1 Tax=Profundicola chukchiensis TaxID=2961959 RepID=UPI0024385676|nr:polysaccharide deacetylase family protein [Profundicola chukchiensis]MDG4950301.1 polysaccharide deacetylase family protein [Profundicola chukchiensis]